MQREPFDSGAEAAALTAGRTDIGAVVAFTGQCRDDARTLDALELEHYPGMAEAEMDRIAAEAEARWPLLGVATIHRFGMIRPGEPIVLVATAAAHRSAAFEAAAYIMDYLKTEAPFWKREHRTKSPSADPRSADAWVAAKRNDDEAAGRWR